MKTTTTKKTSTVKKTATPAKKTVSRAKPAAKRPVKKAPVKKAASGGAPRADLDAVRASERRARCNVSSGARARGHRADRDPTDEKNARDSTQIAFPFGDRPAWLDGSLPGDRGFDPFELGKKSEYLQFSPDALDGSAAKNPSGNVIGKVKATDNKPKARTLAVRARARACVFFCRPVRVVSRLVYRSRGGRRSASSIGYRSRPRSRKDMVWRICSNA